MSNIFEINQKYIDLINEIEENEGELTEELSDRLKITREELDDKLNAYGAVVKGKQATNTILKEEVTRLQGRMKANDNVALKLKNIVKDTLAIFNFIGKSGNLSYKTAKYTFFTKDTESVTLKEELFSSFVEASDKYGDLLQYNINEALTLDQIAIINQALIDAGQLTLSITPSMTKTRFKEALEVVEAMEDVPYEITAVEEPITDVDFEDSDEIQWENAEQPVYKPKSERERLLLLLDELGSIGNNSSLQIR